MVAGGAKAAQQYLAAGPVDEMDISLVPILLGAGERLFEGLGADLHGLKLVRTIAAPGVTHLKYRGSPRRRTPPPSRPRGRRSGRGSGRGR